ncbi:MAG: hypothetical protein DHS20C01_27550 [marine bacterium B5-7]|nr:MAG: hypothetical protein DHS20C01_27550 [marine bacterium B5-7]
MSAYAIIKTIHVASVIASGSGFLLRGIWMLNDSPLLQHRLTRVLPHIIDTVLLLSALTLMTMTAQYPTTAPWVATKIVALLVYIIVGSIALKRGKSRRIRIMAFILALTTFGYIVAVALTRSSTLGLYHQVYVTSPDHGFNIT